MTIFRRAGDCLSHEIAIRGLTALGLMLMAAGKQLGIRSVTGSRLHVRSSAPSDMPFVSERPSNVALADKIDVAIFIQPFFYVRSRGVRPQHLEMRFKPPASSCAAAACIAHDGERGGSDQEHTPWQQS